MHTAQFLSDFAEVALQCARITPGHGLFWSFKDYASIRTLCVFAAEDGQLDAATAASLAGSESNVESSSKDEGIAGADTASLSD